MSAPSPLERITPYESEDILFRFPPEIREEVVGYLNKESDREALAIASTQHPICTRVMSSLRTSLYLGGISGPLFLGRLLLVSPSSAQQADSSPNPRDPVSCRKSTRIDIATMTDKVKTDMVESAAKRKTLYGSAWWRLERITSVILERPLPEDVIQNLVALGMICRDGGLGPLLPKVTSSSAIRWITPFRPKTSSTSHRSAELFELRFNLLPKTSLMDLSSNSIVDAVKRRITSTHISPDSDSSSPENPTQQGMQSAVELLNKLPISDTIDFKYEHIKESGLSVDTFLQELKEKLDPYVVYHSNPSDFVSSISSSQASRRSLSQLYTMAKTTIPEESLS